MPSHFVCTYRKAMLVGQLNDDVKRIVLSTAENSDFEIEEMQRDAHHVHFLIRYIPRSCATQIVRRLKQESTRQLWLLHGKTLRKQYWLASIVE